MNYDGFHCCRWWKKKKSELRKKRDKTKSSHPQTDETKSKRTIDRPSRIAQADPKRGFRSTVVAAKIEQPSHVKRESSGSDRLEFTKPLSRSIEAELTSGSESESSTESMKSSTGSPKLSAESMKSSTQSLKSLTTISMKSSTESLKSKRESESVKKSTKKQKRDTQMKLSRSKEKPESPSAPSAGTAFKKRYILFLGNLPRDASQDDIIDHFSKRGVAISELRLLTEKESGKSKGCAFAEFNGNKAMQDALKFHRSKLQGRTINVEVTCGGGGEGNERLKKIRERNRTLRRATAVKSGKVMKSKIRT